MTAQEALRKLTELAQLDVDAIGAYDAAIRRASEPLALQDEKRHLAGLKQAVIERPWRHPGEQPQL